MMLEGEDFVKVPQLVISTEVGKAPSKGMVSFSAGTVTSTARSSAPPPTLGLGPPATSSLDALSKVALVGETPGKAQRHWLGFYERQVRVTTSL